MKRSLQRHDGKYCPGDYRAEDRRGAAATLDYVLVMGVILPAAAFSIWAGPRIIRLAYEMVYVLVVWPFM